MKRKLIALQVERNRAHGRSMMRRRLERATRMLRETDRSAASIAAACGYTDDSKR